MNLLYRYITQGRGMSASDHQAAARSGRAALELGEAPVAHLGIPC